MQIQSSSLLGVCQVPSTLVSCQVNVSCQGFVLGMTPQAGCDQLVLRLINPPFCISPFNMHLLSVHPSRKTGDTSLTSNILAAAAEC